jgi:hypothetical protein
MTDSLHVVCPQCDGINRIPQIKLGAGGKCGSCHQPLFTGEPLELNQARFRRHLAKSDIPLLIGTKYSSGENKFGTGTIVIGRTGYTEYSNLDSV